MYFLPTDLKNVSENKKGVSNNVGWAHKIRK